MQINKTNLKINGSLKWGNYPTKIILHHPEFYGTVEELNQIMIDDGFSMIGYNHYIRKDGSIWEGRPIDAIGGNCYGQNATSIGIAFEGNFMADTMPDAQFNAGVELCKYLMKQYPSIQEIGPHNRYYNTECPGINFPVDRMITSAKGGGIINISISDSNSSGSNNLIKLWDSGSAVKALQEKLIKLGYDLGQWGADGIFGQSTFNAVESFQHNCGIGVDGIVGPTTLNAINSALNKPAAFDIKYLQHELNVQMGAGIAEDNIPGPATLEACPLVKKGAEGNITRWIQANVNSGVDGVFGYNTLVAVQNFQAKHGLNADGIIGKNTWKALLGL